jgi:hypothetical protein
MSAKSTFVRFSLVTRKRARLTFHPPFTLVTRKRARLTFHPPFTPVSGNAIIRRNALDSMPGLQVFGNFGQKWQMEVLCYRRRTQSEIHRTPLKFGFQNDNHIS